MTLAGRPVYSRKSPPLSGMHLPLLYMLMQTSLSISGDTIVDACFSFVLIGVLGGSSSASPLPLDWPVRLAMSFCLAFFEEEGFFRGGEGCLAGNFSVPLSVPKCLVHKPRFWSNLSQPLTLHVILSLPCKGHLPIKFGQRPTLQFNVPILRKTGSGSYSSRSSPSSTLKPSPRGARLRSSSLLRSVMVSVVCDSSPAPLSGAPHFAAAAARERVIGRHRLLSSPSEALVAQSVNLFGEGLLLLFCFCLLAPSGRSSGCSRVRAGGLRQCTRSAVRAKHKAEFGISSRLARRARRESAQSDSACAPLRQAGRAGRTGQGSGKDFQSASPVLNDKDWLDCRWRRLV